MRNNHALLHRNDVRAWLVAVALGCLSLSLWAAPVNKGNIGRLGVNQTGRTTTLTPGAPPVNSGGSTIPVSPTSGGWTQAGNYGVPPNATGPTAGLNVNGTFIQGERGNYNIGGAGGVQGVKYPVSGGYQIPWGTIAPVAAGIVCVVSSAGVCAVAGGVAALAPRIMDWIKGDDGKVQLNGDKLELDVTTTPPVSDGYRYSYNFPVCGQSMPYELTRQMALDAIPGWFNPRGGPGCTAVKPADMMTSCRYVNGSAICACGPSYPNCYNGAETRLSNASCPSGMYIVNGVCSGSYERQWKPMTMDDVIGRMSSRNPDPRVWGETLERGGTIDMPNPTVTGPTQIQGPETVKQNQDGTREVSRPTYNFTTNNNQVINTSVTTTTNTYNSSNVQTGTSTTTTTPSDNSPGSDQEKEDECAKHPDVIGCQKIDFDTPDGQIPKETKDVTFQAENVLGGGSCPADVYAGMTSTGQTLKVWDWQATCNYFLPIRFILMALAAFSAVLIIMPGGGKSV